MLEPVETPNVAVPILVTLPGAVAGFQFALALKSNVPVDGPPTVGVADQLASCAPAGADHANVPISRHAPIDINERHARLVSPVRLSATPPRLALPQFAPWFQRFAADPATDEITSA
jgi:hypothetical protein